MGLDAVCIFVRWLLCVSGLARALKLKKSFVAARIVGWSSVSVPALEMDQSLPDYEI
jgi:hypothetical protein